MKRTQIKIPHCKKYTGYKPCIPYKNCLTYGCQDDVSSNRIGKKILIVALEGLGAVLSTTTILPALKRKYPVSSIHWITKENAKAILSNNPYVDTIFIWNDEQRMIVRNIEYDILVNPDKSTHACAFAMEAKAKLKMGFLLNEDGVIIPANDSAIYNYRMGVDDELKFHKNKRTGINILHETAELKFKMDEYVFKFSGDETKFIQSYKRSIDYRPKYSYIGLNTGCAPLFPNKKMTIEQHIKLIRMLLKDRRVIIVLLGGKEDTDRNAQILKYFLGKDRKRIISTPTNLGIRKGACYMAICDLVITGDSFGMHLAIALKKYVIVWFGLSCWTEIELYGRGVKLYPKNLECAPCWKKVCPYNLECIEMIDLDRIYDLTIGRINIKKKVPAFEK
jgi:heptosyltransferase-2